MIYVILGILALFALLALLTVAKRKLDVAEAGPAADAPWPFDVTRLMTDPERTLYHRLVEALPQHLVFAQVGASRVLRTRKGPDQTAWHNRIAQLSFDFVVCSKDTHPVLVIELDDASHARKANRERDAKKDRASRDAGLPLVRWNVQDLPDREAIRRELAARITTSLADADAPA